MPTASGEATEASSPESGSITGIKLIFWLFVVLAVATAVILLWFIQASTVSLEADAQATMAKNATAGLEKQQAIPQVLFRLHAALAGNLAMPVAAWFILRGIAEPGQRTRWFVVAAWSALATFAAILLLLVAIGRIPLPG